MSKAGFIGRAIFTGAVLGALAGYAEAAFLILFSKVYFTAAGKIGLLAAAAALYAVYGGAAAAILAGVWRLFRRVPGNRAAASIAVLSVALLYSVSFLLSLGVVSGASILSARFFLWFAGLFIASLLAAGLAGAVAVRILKSRRAAIAAVCAIAAIGVCLFLPVGKKARPGSGLPSVVLVTIDTIRADRINCYGYDRIKTPVIDGLSSEGVLFEKAVCQIPITNPSHQSILSSRYPHQTGLINNWYRRPPGITTIVDEFRKQGYGTAAFVSAFPLNSRFGFAEGFDVYDDDSSRVKGVQSLSLVRIADVVMRRTGASTLARRLELKRDARRTNREVFSWLENRGEPPFFLWVHYFDPHGPYTPPAPYSEMYYAGVKDDPSNRSMDGIKLQSYWSPDLLNFTDIGYPIAQYDAEITYTDAELGRLVKELDERVGDYILVVVGDHGESLTEHGTYFHHGAGLYEEQIMVPLIIRRKGSIGPARVSSPVENVDIAPTVLEMAGLAVPDCFQGESLLPLMRGEKGRSKEGVLSETGGRKQDGTIDIAYRTERYKLIVMPGEGVELYDLENDPRELNDISGERKDLVETFRDRISSVLEGQVREASEVMDPETEEKLRSLGYLR